MRRVRTPRVPNENLGPSSEAGALHTFYKQRVAENGVECSMPEEMFQAK